MLKRLATFKLKQSASRVQRLADPHGFEDASGSVVSSCSGLCLVSKALCLELGV